MDNGKDTSDGELRGAWRGGISSEDSPLMGIVEHLVASGDLSVTLRSGVAIKSWRLNTDVGREVA